MFRRSTREFFKLHGFKDIGQFIHGYIYGRFPNWYIGKLREMGDKAGSSREKAKKHSSGARKLQERYHSKVLVTEDARKVIHLDKPVEVENPERVIPFEIANRIVVETPGKVAVIDCPCRETMGGDACGPKDVCMVVGSPYVEFVVDHKVNNARELTREEATGVLETAAANGWVHTAWFKDAMGGRFYAICNCCSCCCMGLGAMQKTRNRARFVTSSGYVAVLDNDLCSGCGTCDEICSFGAIEIIEGRAVINARKCFGCGVCANLCPNGAAVMVLDPDKGVPMDLDVLV
jgi:ferredoxin